MPAVTVLVNQPGTVDTAEIGTTAGDVGRPGHLQHHFDTPRQQYEAAKLGMWLFLATEVLLFGGLFCAYAIFRALHPALFAYGSLFLDTTWGAINTAVLIVSSTTMAIAVWCAQCGHRRALVLFLALTLLCAVDFMGIKYIEYSHKIREHQVWGLTFYESKDLGPAQVPAGSETMDPAVFFVADPAKGSKMWMNTCRSCHGAGGEGMPGQGKDLRVSEFVTGKTDTELVEFVKGGRMPFDPLNTTGVMMPPRGGNPMLTDEDLAHIVSFVRTLMISGGGTAAQAGGGTAVDAVTDAGGEPDGFWVPMSSIPIAPAGPTGLDLEYLDRDRARWQPSLASEPSVSVDRPENAHMFFGIYFLMTGLHGLHVLGGIMMLTWLLVRAFKGHFGRDYFTPVDLGGLYWHIVDLIWIFLFPLLYLIR